MVTLGGVLMIINNDWWPIMSLIGGAIYLDTSGREAVKNISFRHEGIKVGTEKQKKLFFARYIVMAIALISYSISALA